MLYTLQHVRFCKYILQPVNGNTSLESWNLKMGSEDGLNFTEGKAG